MSEIGMEYPSFISYWNTILSCTIVRCELQLEVSE